jgi:hypothetical protein
VIVSDSSDLLVVFDLRTGNRHDPTFEREKEWIIVPNKMQMPVIRSKIGEVGLMGRARRESARLNGKTRASGVSSFSCFSFPSLSFPQCLLSCLASFLRVGQSMIWA